MGFWKSLYWSQIYGFNLTCNTNCQNGWIASVVHPWYCSAQDQSSRLTIPATRGLFSLVLGGPRWDRRKRAVLPLGYMNFNKFIFRQVNRLKLIGSWFRERSANFKSVFSGENKGTFCSVGVSPLQYSALFALSWGSRAWTWWQLITTSVPLLSLDAWGGAYFPPTRRMLVKKGLFSQGIYNSTCNKLYPMPFIHRVACNGVTQFSI